MSAGIFVAITAGIAIAAQVATIGRTSARVHPLAISLALQLSGVLVGLGWMAWARTWPGVVEVVRLWWWIPLGIVGWIVVAALGFASARLGTGTALATAISAQVVAGLLIDRTTGSLELGIPQLIGVVLLVAGAALVAWR